MTISSTRSDILVETREDGAALTLFARNALVSWITSIAGAALSLWLLAIAAYGLASANYVNAVLAVALTVATLWLTLRLSWRPKPFPVIFSTDSLQAGPHRYAYDEIRDYGLSRYGGDVVDTVSIGVPRNVTIGPHLYIDTGERHLPITVGLKEAQAKEALRLFGLLFERYRSPRP